MKKILNYTFIEIIERSNQSHTGGAETGIVPLNLAYLLELLIKYL